MFKRKKIIYKNIKFLKFLFNYFIPKSKKYNLPSSSFLLEDDFINIEYKDEKFIKKIIDEFCEINNYIYNKKLDSLNTFEIDKLILAYKKKYRLNYTKIGQLILNYYYTNKNILKIIGYKNSPPFPKGNYLIEGDLYLFEHVIEKDKMYRD